MWWICFFLYIFLFSFSSLLYLALLLDLGFLDLVMISNAFCDGVLLFFKRIDLSLAFLFALHGARVGFAYCYTIA